MSGNGTGMHRSGMVGKRAEPGRDPGCTVNTVCLQRSWVFWRRGEASVHMGGCHTSSVSELLTRFMFFFHRRIVCSIINIHRQNLTFVKNKIKFPSVIILCIVCPRPHTLLSCRPSTHPTTPEPPSSSMDTSSVLMPFLKNPHAIHPDQDTNGCLMKAANEKSSCAELRGNGGKWR